MGALAISSSAHATTPAVFIGDNYDPASPITCAAQSGQSNVRLCSGLVKTWDGTVIDVNVVLPPDPGVGQPDGDYPLIGTYHGWGGAKVGLNGNPPAPTGDRVEYWATHGYAVFSMSDRGWGGSCGGMDSKRVTEAATGCAEGYNHLLDTRFEVRDAQYLMSLLADEGVIDGQRIGATGPSYGGGMSMALAALKDRIMKPDGTGYLPWLSPNGQPMRIAAAAPDIPWTDLAYSLQPNGATLDYVSDAPYRGPNADKRIGVLKQSFVAGLYALGQAGSNYAPPGTDPDADLTQWYAAINAGEPYDTNPLSNDVVDEITSHHSSYYIDHSTPPAPLLISNGWTDDLFPPDEAIRFYNRTRTQYPTANIGLFFMDWGHQRGKGRSNDVSQLRDAQEAWFNYYVKGAGSPPFEGVTTLPQVCSGPASGPSGTSISASSWKALTPGEVHYATSPSDPLTNLQAISPQAGNPQTNAAFDPIAGNNACATANATDVPGAANYRLPAAPAGGYTLAGSPTIVADFYSPGLNSQIAARLLDVDSAGNETLVARGLWRPHVDNGVPAGTRQVFQLHPNRWRFDQGHVAKLELLPNDQPYGRNSNGQAPITVQNLELRIPVLEQPSGGVVEAPKDKILPPGYALAADYLPATSDPDNDGWPNDSDNCPNDTNPTQADSDGDGIGDACDTVNDDTDGDGHSNTQDNCPSTYNPAQDDGDNDGIGDVCDPSNDADPDGDGVLNDQDNCPNTANPGQQDVDGDGIGNACDPQNNNDLDDDGVDDSSDNCQGVSNPGQQDTDGDGLGNACDSLDDNDFDEDGVPNTTDNCDVDVNAGQQNSDADPLGDACDPDDDNDGILDTSDACRTQAGMTGDGCPLIPGSGGSTQQSQQPAASGAPSQAVIVKKCRVGKGKAHSRVKRCKRKPRRAR